MKATKTSPKQPSKTLSQDHVRLMNAYWRAANYLSVGQIYLLDNPLLKAQLKSAHIKRRRLGHWGTTPGWTPALSITASIRRPTSFESICRLTPTHCSR